MSHYSASCLSVHFGESAEIEMCYQTNLDCHLAHTFSWHGPKASAAIPHSKQNPKFSRAESGSEMLGPRCPSILSISSIDASDKAIGMNDN